MKVLIDIPEETYNNIHAMDWKNPIWASEELKAIHDGIIFQDVIEREKIDKAIKEIENCTFAHTIKEAGWDEHEDVFIAKEETEVVRLDTLLEIIKRNIG